MIRSVIGNSFHPWELSNSSYREAGAHEKKGMAVGSIAAICPEVSRPLHSEDPPRTYPKMGKLDLARPEALPRDAGPLLVAMRHSGTREN
jgi:hypothetical protein